MRFQAFQTQRDRVLVRAAAGEAAEQTEAEQLHPLVLAYIGDAYFSLYVRQYMIGYEPNKVQVLHTLDAKVVSASMQAKACMALEPDLTEEEQEILRRGRNTRSQVPKSATVAEYRYSTAFEALLGYWYLKGDTARLEEMASRSLKLILTAMQEERKGGK